MPEERYLVTGALGCIGAWSIKHLLDDNQQVWTYDLGGSKHRLELIMNDEAISRIHFISGDITDFAAFQRAVTENGITHIIHLAALQIPLVRANPVVGAQVNLMGMANVLETIRQNASQIQGFSYASSVAVYGPPGAPKWQTASLYGVHKQAKEGMARVYWQDYKLPSIGLRPHTVYGPGRDQGMTSSPTKAMLAAAAGRDYQITFGGTALYHHASDTAAAFIKAANTRVDGAYVFDLDGILAGMNELVASIETVVPEMAGRITWEEKQLPVSWDTNLGESVIGTLNWVPLTQGVQLTIDQFRAAVKSGKIDIEKSLA
jgi:nucleoside-diphosphate-sugar epimerase